MTNIGQVAGGTISNGQGCYGASLLPDSFKKNLLTLAEDRCAINQSLTQSLNHSITSTDDYQNLTYESLVLLITTV